MKFSFSTDNFNKKMKADGIWREDVNQLIRNANKRSCFRATPKFRRDCLNGKRMLLSQARKVIESGFIKTSLDREELAESFYLNREQVDETLDTYYKLIHERFNYGDDGFKSIEEVFAALVTSDDLMDYHWNVLDDFFESAKQQFYAMNLTETTHLERRECFYFCLLMTKLAGGEFFVGDGFVRVKSGYAGERYVQTVYDLSWFLAGKVLGTLKEAVTPSEFFGQKGDWYKYNEYPTLPTYIVKVMEARERMIGGVTTNEDIEGLFEEGAAKELLIDKVIPKEKYLDIKLLEWATKVKEGYSQYAEIL